MNFRVFLIILYTISATLCCDATPSNHEEICARTQLYKRKTIQERLLNFPLKRLNKVSFRWDAFPGEKKSAFLIRCARQKFLFQKTMKEKMEQFRRK
ncbi:hypothetical protein Bealeia1_01146 [Candidatus Bealeia paramacronuclearis]|uniref:Uncharacterized protein n=1 Tax=Candidatus Bealeia paramacronuclearis TaxID=1921001 RepID=A0ABZ2C3D8_9PROT|nr:hypothetical protein [Candidatus Bealeia paramacronuclearis]